MNEIKTELLQQQTPAIPQQLHYVTDLIKKGHVLTFKTDESCFKQGQAGRTSSRYQFVSLFFIPSKLAYNSNKLRGKRSLCILELAHYIWLVYYRFK